VKDQLAAGGGRVDLLGQAPEADAASLQLGHRLDQVPERSPEPVEAPHHQGVALAGVLQRLHQGSTLDEGAAGGLGEELVAPGRREGVELKVEGLLTGRDPGVPDVHDPIVSKPGVAVK